MNEKVKNLKNFKKPNGIPVHKKIRISSENISSYQLFFSKILKMFIYNFIFGYVQLITVHKKDDIFSYFQLITPVHKKRQKSSESLSSYVSGKIFKMLIYNFIFICFQLINFPHFQVRSYFTRLICFPVTVNNT